MTMALRPTHVPPVSLDVVADRARAVRVDGPAAVALTGATVDSREVREGDLFGAFPGFATHGARFAADAQEAGASAILTDEEGVAVARAAGVSIPIVVADAPRRAMALASCAIYSDPSRRLPVIGITGTNGKTTTSFLIEGALARAYEHTALLGTIEARIADEHRLSERTTVEAPALQALLARALEKGVGAVVTEASSQAIDLERVTGTRFAVAVFTNLSYEHMDYHHTMEEYFAVKRRLFTPELSERAVVLVDDEWGRRLAAEASVPVTTVATRPGSPDADWVVTGERLAASGGMEFDLRGPNGASHVATVALPGHINVSNAAAAIVASHVIGVPVEAAIEGVAHARQVPGRTEVVTQRTATTPLIVVDYAHTPDGVAAVLDAMRGVTPGRLFVVFGCDGLRDDSKRPGLGRAAATHSDVVIVTDENPKTEPPEFIRSRLMEGVVEVRPRLENVLEVAPRSEAVLTAMRMAGPADTIITTGKGHETTQEIDGVHYPYTDRAVVLEELASRGAAS
ncbi:UDP-N-acetylmuramoyl-L-alanyl-D-glutamate--2,6-diaminopimelate ligase [Demequina sp. TTPB684]|uniref:UDP-N-acetylmuramoyl-L-alanyl-D-glutamate--2, 6-diaminopimelate ligase n=1 Tax=unclassified Demequina TaxID=2620311 RepID=UPI001CF52692|nr:MULTISPECIES: UDP-N-acetylmuramoyl-L-alanyl-D-glutamate--2,6-diaminopimelate ligase [unclassified Demequina]MCB2411589.1 UDP-N-acetylmuramoyl-L-alanyl-D-glutamate--2,6-diaminopimelate ligase [Demequina sp. TTPB684]UPU89570.1 UDP-N-acetylmuramoyl-L-alanyl-D-glutamate--2,6-diaminopimelate ligase [Demequina sp. TMPB413]